MVVLCCTETCSISQGKKVYRKKMNQFVTSTVLWKSHFAETKTVTDTNLAQAVSCHPGKPVILL